MQQNSIVAKWNIEKIWEKWSSIVNHKDAFSFALHTMIQNWSIKTEAWKFTVDAIGHRVVHGGEYFQTSVRIDTDVITKIEACSLLAPLHNPVNVECIRACIQLLPNIPQVAVFDTSFHQTMEPVHYLYPIPYTYYEKYKIRRYGFHGTSHQYVYEQLIEKLKSWEIEKLKDRKIEDLKVITCHIGNGASIAAITNWKVVETSMGMTPLEWLMMGTRSGNIDPALIFHLHKHEKLSDDTIQHMLEYESWLLGISWVSGDMRDVVAWIQQWNPRCSLALDMYINALIKYVWAYASILWWVDVIILTAGVMEHRTIVRTMFLEKLSWMWVVIDTQANHNETSLEKIVSTPDSKVTVLVIPTNEELMIAKETFKLINN